MRYAGWLEPVRKSLRMLFHKLLILLAIFCILLHARRDFFFRSRTFLPTVKIVGLLKTTP